MLCCLAGSAASTVTEPPSCHCDVPFTTIQAGDTNQRSVSSVETVTVTLHDVGNSASRLRGSGRPIHSIILLNYFTSAKEVVFYPVFVCLSVC